MRENNDKSIYTDTRGQLMLEILLVIGVVAIAAALVSQLALSSLRGNQASIESTASTGLIKETMEAVAAASFSKWQNIYSLTKDSAHYYATTSASGWQILAGEETLRLNDKNLVRYFTVSDVCRDSAKQIVATATAPCGGLTNDPSTQKITATVGGSGQATTSESQYLTRWRNKIYLQSGWTASSSETLTCPVASTTCETSFFGGLSNLVATGTGSTSLQVK